MLILKVSNMNQFIELLQDKLKSIEETPLTIDERFPYNDQILCDCDGLEWLKCKTMAMNTHFVLYERMKYFPNGYTLFEVSGAKSSQLNLWVKSKLKLMLDEYLMMEELGYDQKSFISFERLRHDGSSMYVERSSCSGPCVRTSLNHPSLNHREYHSKGMIEAVIEYERKYSLNENFFSDMNDKLRDLVTYGLVE